MLPLDVFPDENAALADGTEVRLRAVRPEDKALLLQGFEELSPESRYLRFLAAKPRLSDEDLRYLTEVDGDHHFALGAVRLREDGSEEPLGIARFVVSKDDPEIAEAAVAVKDAMHGKGVGKLLLHRLANVAANHGVKRFRCTVLADNAAMRALLTDLDPGAHVIRAVSGVAEIELLVPQPNEAAEALKRRLSLDRFLAHVAKQLAAVRVSSVPDEPLGD